MPNRTPTTGAIIVNWNTRDHVLTCVESFLSDGLDQSDIRVVDQGSHDGSVKSLRSRFPSVEVQVLPENAGYGHAVNTAVRSMDHDFVVVSNADVIVHKGTLKRLSQFLAEDQSGGLVGCRVLDQNGGDGTRFTRLSMLRAVLLEVIPQSLRGLWRDYQINRHSEETPFDVTYVEGAFFMVRRSAFESVGGFDEGFSFFFEDADLPVRMIKAGMRVVHVPDVAVTHVGGASFSQAPMTHAAEFNKNLVRFYERHAFRRSVWLRRLLITVIATKVAALWLMDGLTGGRMGMSARLKFNRVKLQSLTSDRSKRHGGLVQPFVSIIVPTVNRPATLLRFLSSLRKQTYKRFEVLIADQGEKPVRLNGHLVKLGKRVDHLRVPIKQRSIAKNVASQRARGDILLFCDDDIVVDTDFVEAHVLSHMDPGIGGVSCRVCEDGLPRAVSTNICRTTFYGRSIPDFQSDVTCYVQTLVGANMSVKRDAFTAAGYFDCFKGTAIFEEQDLSARILDLGYKILFTNISTVQHFPQHDGNLGIRQKNPSQYYHDFHHNELVYFLKNRNHLLLFFVIPFCLLRSARQSLKYSQGVRGIWRMFSGVFAGISSYYRSLW